MSQIKLRSYQQRAVDAVLRYYARGGTRPLLHLFTGGGKSYLGLKIASEVANFTTPDPQRVLYLAHTRELTDQPYQSLYKLLPSLRSKYYGKAPAAGIVRASRNQADARFLFATMQTLANNNGQRLDEVLSHGAFDLCLIDEVHHVAAKSYSEVIVPKLLEANPNMKLLGLTATPARSDGKALDSYFDDIVFSMSLLDGINGGWLKAMTPKRVKTEVSLGDIARYNGDFQESALRNALRVQNWTEIVGQAYMEHDGPSRSAIAFMPSVEMGHELGEWFRKQGIKAGSVAHDSVIDADGTVYSGNGTYWKARDRILNEFRASELQVLIGYSVLLEGFDARNTDLILQGRPTESMVLLTQLLGRGVRTPDGVSRLLQDHEKEKYLVQRDGDDDRWYEYAYDKLPFNPDCVVLDFTLKDTSVLLAGSLAGNKTADVEDVEPETETLEIFEVEPVPNELDIIMKQGKGVQYFKRNFFRMSNENWTIWDDTTMSTYLGAQGEGKNRIANALFIYPRQKMMVSRMDEVMQVIEQLEGKDCGVPVDTMYTQYNLAQQLKDAFNSFLLFTLQNIPVTVTEKNGYESEWVQWNSSQIDVQFGDEQGRHGRHVDHNAVWEAALPVSQRLTVGGFFVEKNRAGAKKRASSAQLDLLLSPTFKSGRPNMFHTLPEYVNNKLAEVPGLDLFRIEKPSRKSLMDDTNIQISGRINHIGIYSAVMKQKLGPQLISAQRMYNLWAALWQQQR